jgi:hypothetical protein
VSYVVPFLSMGIGLGVLRLVQVRRVCLSGWVLRATISSKCAIGIYHFMLLTRVGVGSN